MDIYKEWEKLGQTKFSSEINKEEIMKAIYTESNSTVSELKKRLGYKMNWSLFFMLLFTIGMIMTYNKPEAMVICGIGILLFIISYLVLRKYHQKIDKNLNPGKDLLSTLKTNETIIKSALSFETTSTLIALPFGIIGAVIFSEIYAGQTITESITETKTLLVSIVTMAIGFPFVYVLGTKLNKIAFGSYLDKLRKNINQLELLD